MSKIDGLTEVLLPDNSGEQTAEATTTETPVTNEETSTETTEESAEETKTETTEQEGAQSTSETNRTDPIVCHDPNISIEGIARIFSNQNKFNGEGDEISAINEFDALRIDAIEYPLVTINERNIEANDIINMTINYDRFLPTISITIRDIHESEQRINTTQMNGLIKIAMISPVDKVYRKILLNFRIMNVSINPNDRSRISYYGEFYVEGFRDVNTMHIWMESVCPKQITCQQGGHVNANTWEMLHQIASLTGLGFAATKNCKDVPDRVVRHIHTQRFNEYIEQQLTHSGSDEENIFDAWVDLYGYIVLVNIPWVLNEDISYKDLTIVANTGIHATSNDLMDQEPQEVYRTLTNYNRLNTKSNLEIESFNTVVNNEAIEDGTLERVYPMSMTENGRFVKLNMLDIQSKQNSIDGEHIEEYNTGKKCPIPRFDFNDDAWTGLTGGYNLNTQKRIREAYLKKLHQSVLNVKLKTINFGLQRGTLVNISIFENDMANKDFIIRNTSRLTRTDDDIAEDKPEFDSDLNHEELVTNSTIWVPNIKLSGLYYIDGMKFEYNPNIGKIDQTIFLIKKGSTSGYVNKFNGLGMPVDKYPDTIDKDSDTGAPDVESSSTSETETSSLLQEQDIV